MGRIGVLSIFLACLIWLPAVVNRVFALPTAHRFVSLISTVSGWCSTTGQNGVRPAERKFPNLTNCGSRVVNEVSRFASWVLTMMVCRG